MNCPSRTDEPIEGDGYNQNPNFLAADLTTREDLNGIANARILRRTSREMIAEETGGPDDPGETIYQTQLKAGSADVGVLPQTTGGGDAQGENDSAIGSSPEGSGGANQHDFKLLLRKNVKMLMTYAKFIGPGFMVCCFFPCSITWRVYSKQDRYPWHILTQEIMLPMLRLEQAIDSSCFSLCLRRIFLQFFCRVLVSSWEALLDLTSRKPVENTYHGGLISYCILWPKLP